MAVATVTSVTPSRGSVNGGQAVTIRGLDFGFVVDPFVKFGNVVATSCVIVDGETITAVTPAHASGVVDVEVVTVENLSIGFNLYTYVLPSIKLPPLPTRTPIMQGGGKRGR